MTHSTRRGATLVETAIVLLVFLTLTFGMLDLAIANLNNNIVNNAARQAARIASVHGTMAPPSTTTDASVDFASSATSMRWPRVTSTRFVTGTMAGHDRNRDRLPVTQQPKPHCA